MSAQRLKEYPFYDPERTRFLFRARGGFAMVSLTDPSPSGEEYPRFDVDVRRDKAGSTTTVSANKREKGGGTYLISVRRSSSQRFSHDIVAVVHFIGRETLARARGVPLLRS